MEFDEVYLTAGHKENPAAVQKSEKVVATNSKGFAVGVRSKRKSLAFSV
jgi:hypothetical protein